MNHIILVEDDERLRHLVAGFLTNNGFSVTAMGDGQALMDTVRSMPTAMIILDVMLPGADGFELCKQIRPYYQGPLLFMTAKSDDFDQVLGLELGADDYVIKPVEPRVLLARVHALLRRSSQPASPKSSQDRLVFGKLVIDQNSRLVTLDNEDVQLTSHEFDMLWKLASHPAELVDRSTLYSELIGREYDGLDRSADVRISRLRKKLQDNPKNPYRIKTIWGKGFFFVPDAWD